MTVAGVTVEEFLRRAVDGDARGATRVALDLLDRGSPSYEVIVDLLGAAQYQVGQRWLDNLYSVAEEHLASGVVQRALDAVAAAVDPPPPQAQVVVACAEGDWHSLPSQMFAEMLRSRGFDVRFLGASTPVEHVARLLARKPPAALVVTCTLPLFFGGVSRLAQAAHDCGVPVLAGGRALGRDPSRALMLGADAWAIGIDTAVSIISAWQDTPPTLSKPTPTHPSISLLDLDAPLIATEAFEVMRANWPAMSSYTDAQLARTREDLAYITRFAGAASLVNDPSVFTDFIDWLQALLSARGVPPAALHGGLTVLTPIIDLHHPPSGDLVRTTAAAMSH